MPIGTKNTYPKYDIGDFLPSPGEDWFWGEGTLSDGRPYRAEVWFQTQITFLDVYMSSLYIEDYSAKQLKELLISEGIVTYDDDLYHRSGFNGENLEAEIKEDASGNPMWKLIIIGDEDGTYVKTFFKGNRYVFFDLLKEAPITEDYLLALRDDKDTLYSCILVNNTDHPIDVAIEGPPAMKILRGTSMTEIVESIETDKSDSFIHKPMSPRSVECLKMRYFDWEFDFENKKYLFLKTQHKAILIGFFMEKYFICNSEQDIPFTDLRGFICPAKIILERNLVPNTNLGDRRPRETGGKVRPNHVRTSKH